MGALARRTQLPLDAPAQRTPQPVPTRPALRVVAAPAGPDWVDDLLHTLGLTAVELAQRVGVARSTPGRWRRGERPRPAVVDRLAAVADLAVEDLAARIYGGPAPREFGPGSGLAQARRAAGLDTSALARRLHVSVSTVSHWESGRRRPDPTLWPALAEALAVSEARLEELASVGSRRLLGTVPGLRPLRLSLGLSQGELGRALGASATTVSHWERGSRPLGWDRLRLLAPLTGLGAGDLAAQLTSAPAAPRTAAPSPLEQLRRDRRLSIEVAARRLRVSRHRLRRWERGEPPPLWVARGLARVYEVPLRRVCGCAGVAPPALLDPSTWTPDRLPEVLRALQDWSGASVARLAGEAAVSPSTVRRWHAGTSLPAPRRLEAVERVYGLAAGELRRLRS